MRASGSQYHATASQSLQRMLRGWINIIFVVFVSLGLSRPTFTSAQIFMLPEDVSFIDAPTRDYDSANAECKTRSVAGAIPAESLVLGGVRYAVEYTQLLSIVTSYINANAATYASSANGGAQTVSFLMAGTDAQLVNTWRWVGGRYDRTTFYTVVAGCVSGFFCNWQASNPVSNSWKHCMAMEGPRPSDPSSTVQWARGNAQWHIVPCNDTKIPAMCRAYRCVVELDCVAPNTVQVSGYFGACKCFCRSGYRGSKCEMIATHTVPLTSSRELTAHSKQQTHTLTLLLSNSQLISNSLSHVATLTRERPDTPTRVRTRTQLMTSTHTQFRSATMPITNTAALTITLHLSPTHTMLPTATKGITSTHLATETMTLSSTHTQLATRTLQLTTTRQQTTTLTRAATMTPAITRTFQETNTIERPRTHTIRQTDTELKTRTPLMSRTSTVSRTLTASLTTTRNAPRTPTVPMAKTSTISLTKLKTRTPLMTRTSTVSTTLTASLTATRNAPRTPTVPMAKTSTVSLTVVLARTLTSSISSMYSRSLSIRSPRTPTLMPDPTQTSVISRTTSIEMTQSRSVLPPVTHTQFTATPKGLPTSTLKEPATATSTRSFASTFTLLASATRTLRQKPTATLSSTLGKSDTSTLIHTLTMDVKTVERSETQTVELPKTTTVSLKSTLTSAKSQSEILLRTETLNVRTITFADSNTVTRVNSLSSTLTLPPPPTPEVTATYSRPSTQTRTPTLSKGSRTPEILPTQSLSLSSSITVTITNEVIPTMSSEISRSGTVSEELEVVLRYLGAKEQMIAPSLAALWVPGIAQCFATRNLSAMPLLYGLDARQIAARKGKLMKEAAIRRTVCHERRCTPKPTPSPPLCADVIVACDGTEEDVIDEIYLLKSLAAQRSELMGRTMMILYRSLSPFVMGPSPVWVLLGSILGILLVAVVQGGLCAPMFRLIYGRYYSWTSCFSGVHGISIAISWSYTLIGGAGISLIFIFLENASRGTPSRFLSAPKPQTLWQWESGQFDDAFKERCDPIQTECSMPIPLDNARLLDACRYCLDYFQARDDSERGAAVGDSYIVSTLALNAYLHDSEWLSVASLCAAVVVFVILMPILSLILVHWYATPRRYFGLPYETDARDGLPSLCCCCRPFLFCCRGWFFTRPLTHMSMEVYDQLDADADDHLVDDWDDADEGVNKVYGCWPYFWPLSNAGSLKSRRYFPKPYYMGVQSDSDVEVEEESNRQERSEVLHHDFVGGDDELAFYRSGSRLRLSLSRGVRRLARRFFRLVACRGFVGPIHIRRLWGPAVSRYRLPSAFWSTMPLWSGLIIEVCSLITIPSIASSFDDVFRSSLGNSLLGCSYVLYFAAFLHFVLAAWLFTGIWKQPLRSPFLNWCAALSWLVTGLHLLCHGIVSSDIVLATEMAEAQEAASQQFHHWDQKFLPQLIGNAIAREFAVKNQDAMQTMLTEASLQIGPNRYLPKEAVTSQMILSLASQIIATVMSGKGVPMYQFMSGGFGAMIPSYVYAPSLDVIDFAAANIDDAMLVKFRETVKLIANSSASVDDLVHFDAPLYTDNYDVFRAGGSFDGNEGLMYGVESLGDLFGTLQGHICLNLFFLLLHTAVIGIRLASAFLFLVSDTFVVFTASGAVKRRKGLKPKMDTNSQYSDRVLPDPQELEKGKYDYYFHYFKDESLLMPNPNDDVSHRAMDNEEVFAEMGWATASGVEEACVAMYDVFRERFGLADADHIEDDGELMTAFQQSRVGRKQQGDVYNYRVIRYRVAKAKGFIPPHADWEVFDNPNRPKLPCCTSKFTKDDKEVQRSSESHREGNKSRARSVAFTNLLQEGFVDESAFGLDDLLLFEDDDTSDAGTGDFAHRRKRAASRMFIAMSANKNNGDTPTTARSRSATIIKKGMLTPLAATHPSSSEANALPPGHREASEDEDGLDREIRRLLIREDRDKMSREEDAGGVSIVLSERAPCGRAFSRRYSMFSPRDENTAKSSATFEKMKRKQSVMQQVEIDDLQIDDCPAASSQPAPPIARRSYASKTTRTVADAEMKEVRAHKTQPPKAKAKSRTRSEFIREMDGDGTL